jgi:hypothetical protein
MYIGRNRSELERDFRMRAEDGVADGQNPTAESKQQFKTRE